MRLEKHPSCASRVRIVRNVRGDICSRRRRLSPAQPAGLHLTYTRRVGCTSVTDMRSLPTIRHRSLFMEASAINQRNLLPRLAVGGAIFYGDRHLLPLLTPLATLPRRPSQWTLLLPLSSFLLSYAHPGKDRDPPDEQRSAILFGREFGNHPGSIARKARVSHMFLLVSVPSDISSESTRGRDRGQPPSPRGYPPSILHNTYFMRDAARGNPE